MSGQQRRLKFCKKKGLFCGRDRRECEDEGTHLAADEKERRFLQGCQILFF